METRNERYQVAREYAKRGWKILPLHGVVSGCCTCRATLACANPGKHPRTAHGLKDASTDGHQIDKWWNKWPEANVGIATGILSALVVLDVDDKNGRAGSRTLQALEAAYGELPATLTSTTGSGRHLYFRHPGGIVSNSASLLGEGLDIRGDAGYVVAPPSIHANGRMYQWANPGTDIASLPDWLMGLLTEPAHQQPTDEPLVPVGQRNTSLTKVAGKLRGRGADRGEIEAELIEANTNRLVEPLPIAEVVRIAKSISNYPKGTSQPNLPWFQFFVRDWFSYRVVRLGNEFQRGWFIQLMASAWERGGAIPASDDILWKLAGASSKELFEAEAQLVIDEFEGWTLPNGSRVLVHPWMAQHYVEQAEKYRQRCEASEKAVAARRAKTGRGLIELPADDRPVDRLDMEAEVEPEAETENTKIQRSSYQVEDDHFDSTDLIENSRGRNL